MSRMATGEQTKIVLSDMATRPEIQKIYGLLESEELKTTMVDEGTRGEWYLLVWRAGNPVTVSPALRNKLSKKKEVVRVE